MSRSTARRACCSRRGWQRTQRSALTQAQAPVAAKEEPEEAAEPAAGAAPGRIEGASGVVKSEPGDGAVIGKVGRPAVGTLGRVKVPKGGFVK